MPSAKFFCFFFCDMWHIKKILCFLFDLCVTSVLNQQTVITKRFLWTLAEGNKPSHTLQQQVLTMPRGILGRMAGVPEKHVWQIYLWGFVVGYHPSLLQKPSVASTKDWFSSPFGASSHKHLQCNQSRRSKPSRAGPQETRSTHAWQVLMASERLWWWWCCCNHCLGS